MVEAMQESAQVAQYEFEITIDAPRARVWRGLTDQLSAWWLPDFHVLGQDSTVSFDARAGGQLLETAGGRQLLWFTVVESDPDKKLVVSGQLTPEWGGPCTTIVSLVLTDNGQGTTLRVSDALYGRVSEQTMTSLEKGWKALFGEGLKKHVEGGN